MQFFFAIDCQGERERGDFSKKKKNTLAYCHFFEAIFLCLFEDAIYVDVTRGRSDYERLQRPSTFNGLD
jgi:hypothetical protein